MARPSLSLSAACVLVLAMLLSRTSAGKDLGGGWEEKKDSDGRVVQQLKIEAPSFTEEDQYGYVMPDRYRCDSCRAVMFHLEQELRKKHPKSRRMKQWEFTDVFDDTCRGSFEGYGIRLINGENALSGPGLRQESELTPGSGAIQMGGESWSKRLGEICRRIVYEELGEDEAYERFYRRFRAEADAAGGAADEASEPGLGPELCARELRECVTGPRPPPAEKKAEPAAGPKAGKGQAAKAKAAAKGGKAPKKPAAAAPAGGGGGKAAAAPAPGRGGGSGSGGGTVDVQTFLRGLAVRHGLTSDEYLAARTVGEWERLTVAMAGRIFNGLATSGGSESSPPAAEAAARERETLLHASNSSSW
eukprot:CAMPEP_0179175416 /NCGR_PEP_ID=MMETSP0796-20121207/86632_1 /TAXON_ID=73915 /ORGANISM="Pyrodinium bahamense, Strain pbaha01" /LENGTH=360 /DNA_ID=CAMNT_0020878753 /DNA_START=94 /DNA_END=1173 /DNA_ORIENTATION=-